MCMLDSENKAHMGVDIMACLLEVWLYSYGPFGMTIITILWNL